MLCCEENEYTEHNRRDMLVEYLQEPANCMKIVEEQLLQLGYAQDGECEMIRGHFVTFESC